MDSAVEEAIQRLSALSAPAEVDADYKERRAVWLRALENHLRTVGAKVSGDLEAEIALLGTVNALASLLRRENLWVAFDERVNRIRKTETITKADIVKAEAAHRTRKQQAAELGISESHLRKLRRKFELSQQ